MSTRQELKRYGNNRIKSFWLSLFCYIALASCNAIQLTPGENGYLVVDGENGYLVVDGEKVMSLNYGYEADMDRIAYGKGNWYLFNKSQTPGEINYEDVVVKLRASVDPKTGKAYPDIIFVRNIPGHDGIYIDGLTEDKDGIHKFREYKYAGEGVSPTYVDYTIKVNRFSFNSSYTSLHADITITSDFEVRIVYSGKTPNDEMEYLLD